MSFHLPEWFIALIVIAGYIAYIKLMGKVLPLIYKKYNEFKLKELEKQIVKRKQH